MIEVGDVLKVTFDVSYPDAARAQNVYHLKLSGIAALNDATALAAIDDWLEDVYDTLASEVKDGVTVNPCPVQKIEWTGTEWEITENIGLVTPAETFGNVGELLPKQCSAFAHFRTDRPKSMGRKFLMGFTETDTEYGYLTSTALTAMADYAAEVLAGAYVDPVTTFVTGVARVAAEVFLAFSLATVTDTVFTQRRRVRGVGI